MDKQQKHNYFQEIIEQHKGILVKVTRAYCRNELDRQDLVQEIMIQIWRALERYDETFKMSTWIYRIALNTSISFYRANYVRIKKHTDINNHAESLATSDPGDSERHLKLLEQFISELKEIDKALIILYLEEKSHVEIGDILGISVSNVGTKVGRIKKELRKRFLELNQD